MNTTSNKLQHFDDSLESHPLLAQVPLTVSPFISLPSAVTLPYTYKSVPSTLPPSIAVDPNSNDKPQYVVSSSGHVARPEDIISSCTALQEHIQRTQADSERAIRDWEAEIKERELAEKRRVAPGWLDRDEKILEPTKVSSNLKQTDLLESQTLGREKGMTPAIAPTSEGDDIDRAFGGPKAK